jgi:hypothetical protein
MFHRKLGSTITNRLGKPVDTRVAAATESRGADAARGTAVELTVNATAHTTAAANTDSTVAVRSKLVKSVEAAELLLEMWTALQGIRSCLETWEQDYEWANQNPSKANPGSKSEGLGKRFALHQFRHRVNWDDLEAITKVIRRMEQEKIAYRDQVDKRGYKEL